MAQQERATGRQNAAELDRMLVAQTDAVWPLERPLLDRHLAAHPPDTPMRVLDVGCGSAEFLARMGDAYPRAELVGVDVDEASLEIAKRKLERFGSRVHLVAGDGADLPAAVRETPFDMVAIRHVLQAVPKDLCSSIVAEAASVLKPGGLLHIMGEEYAHLLMAHHTSWSDEDVQLIETFGRNAFCSMYAAGGCDARIGRKLWSIFARTPELTGRSIDYIAVDSASTKPEALRRILDSWKCGYSDMVFEAGSEVMSQEKVARCFDLIDQAIDEPEGYFAWMLAGCQAIKQT